MAKKYRKLKKQKLRYRKRRDRNRVVKTVLFIVLLLVLMFLAYSVMDPIKKLLSGELGNSSTLSSSAVDTSSRTESVTSETVSSEPEKVVAELKGTTMPIATALDAGKRDAFIAKAKEDGYTAVMVELKDASGKVWFQSEAVAALCKAAVDEKGLSAQELTEKIKAAGLIPVAAVHTFMDKTAPHKTADNTFLITGSNSTWWDNSADKGGKPWLNPHKEKARSYNVTVVEELAKAGFAEIVLRSVQFPDISYKPRTDMTGEKSTAEILTQYVEEAKTAAEANGARVSISYDSVGYWTAKEISYGGEAGGIKSARISPVIRMSDYGKKLTIGETVVEDTSADVAVTIRTVITAIQAKTAEQETELIPIIASGQNTAAIISALQTAGIESYITE